jgi:molybdopterin biosynthesis enzyme MoaB
MINTALIIPTGNEIKSGVVLDIDSPEVMRVLLQKFPKCRITRIPPVADDQDQLIQAAEEWADSGVDLIVFIGGSGGGHRYSSTLSEDYTHSALESWLDNKCSYKIFGKNGHLWCNLICGTKNRSLVINLPGPYKEARAAIKAFVNTLEENPDLKALNNAMKDAVVSQYPV